jgi:hypothetical protein
MKLKKQKSNVQFASFPPIYNKLIQNLNNLNRPFKQSLASIYTNNPKRKFKNMHILTTCSLNYTFCQPLVLQTIDSFIYSITCNWLSFQRLNHLLNHLLC